MKLRIAAIGVAVAFGMVAGGCAERKNIIAQSAATSRQDVFRESLTPEPVSGKALLKVEFPVKTYKSRLLNTYTKHTAPPYSAVLNIDGQALALTDEPVLEELPGSFRDNPEAGKGWRYNFRKALLLTPGKHRISISIPLSDIIEEKEIDLKEGENVLKILPVYTSSVSRYRTYPRFSLGVQSIMIELSSGKN